MSTYSDLVRPLGCLMPRYDRGLCRRAVMALALKVSDLLSCRRNEAVRADRGVPPGKILSASETAAMFPHVDRVGLTGGASWGDAVMPSSHRVIMEMLRWAAPSGRTVLNHVEAQRSLVGGAKRWEHTRATPKPGGASYTGRWP